MKKLLLITHLIIFIFGGLIAWYLSGLYINGKQKVIEKTVSNTQPINPPFKKPAAKTQSIDPRFTKLENINNNLTRDLESARIKIAELERSYNVLNVRNNMLIESYKRRGGGLHSRNMNIGLDDSLNPRKNSAKFHGLNQKESEALQAIGQETFRKITDWELKHASIIENTGSLLSYDIPAGLEAINTLKLNYINRATSILGEEEMVFLSSDIDQFFNVFKTRRQLYFKITDEFSELHYDFSYKKINTEGKVTGSGSNSGGPDVFRKRYGHLFILDDLPAKNIH